MERSSELIEYMDSVELKPLCEDIFQAASVVYRLLPALQRLAENRCQLEESIVRSALHASTIIFYLMHNFDSLPLQYAVETESLKHDPGSDDESTANRLLLPFYDEMRTWKGGPVAYVARKVLQTRNGVKYTDLVARYLHAADQVHALQSLCETDCLSDGRQTMTRTEAYLLLDRVFQMRDEHVDEAIDRILNLHHSGVSFDTIAAIVAIDFSNRTYHDRATVFCDRLYDRLITGTIRPGFLETVAQPHNESALLKSLLVSGFCQAYCRYLINSLARFRYNADFDEFVQQPEHEFSLNFDCLIWQLGKILNARHCRSVRSRALAIYTAEEYKLDESVIDVLWRQCFVNSYNLYE